MTALGPGRGELAADVGHPSQRTKRLRGGRVRMELELPVTPDVVAWLVGWGPMVRVQEPEMLAEAVLAEHRAALCGIE